MLSLAATAAGLLLLSTFAAVSATPQPAASPARTGTELWAADQLRAGNPVDFTQRCGGSTSGVGAPPDPGGCRTLSGAFVAQLLAGRIVPQSQWPLGGLQLISARIGGEVDISGASVLPRIAIRFSTIEHAALIMRDSRLDQSLLLECDDVGTDLEGQGMHVGGNIRFSGSRFGGVVSLIGAQTAGFVYAGGAQFAGVFAMGNAHVGQTLSLVAAPGTMCGADKGAPPLQTLAAADMALDAMDIGGNLLIQGTYRSGTTDKHGKATGSAISAKSLRLRGTLSVGADIGGSLDLSHIQADEVRFDENATLSGRLIASRSRVAGDVDLSQAHFGDSVQLDNASIGGVLTLSGAHWAAGSPRPLLDLRNTSVGRLYDDAGAWANERHDVAGFVYDSLANRDRAGAWRRAWLAQDEAEGRAFDPQPYLQLGAVLTRSGEKAAGTEPGFWARERERDLAWATGDWLHYAGLTFWAATVGYGIGGHIFRLLYWVVGATILGAIMLGPRPVKQHGALWVTLAALDRLLPVIHLSPEFEHFFSDRTVNGLGRWRFVFFCFVALLGWLLGAFLASALGLLTQG